MPAVGIRFAGMAGRMTGPGRQPEPSDEGAWLVGYDPDAYGGRGHARWSHDPVEAMRFASQGEAMRFWRTPSTVRPLRADGSPNRPLTACSVWIEAIPDEGD